MSGKVMCFIALADIAGKKKKVDGFGHTSTSFGFEYINTCIIRKIRKTLPPTHPKKRILSVLLQEFYKVKIDKLGIRWAKKTTARIF